MLFQIIKGTKNLHSCMFILFACVAVSIQRKYGNRSSLRNAENGQKKAKDGSIPPDLSLASHSKGDAV